MYRVDKGTKETKKIEESTFTEMGFKERTDIQEWIANNPFMLGEELLIIQKEFAGFNDTRERLDLLALDKDMNLVIIENKLDDSGRDVVWQASKYAAYCSTLTTEGIKQIFQEYLDRYYFGQSADQCLSEFYNGIDPMDLQLNSKNTERIILVAGNFRKEVTSTILWMRGYNIDIKCIKITPYTYNEEIFLDVEQIIPVKELEDYMIGLELKANSEVKYSKRREKTLQKRVEFWTRIIEEMNEKSELCKNLSASDKNTLNCSTGINGLKYTFVETSTYTAVELAIKSNNVLRNKQVFDILIQHREQIEGQLGANLQWDRGENKKESRISWQFDGVNLDDDTERKLTIHNLVEKMQIFVKVLSMELKRI